MYGVEDDVDGWRIRMEGGMKAAGRRKCCLKWREDEQIWRVVAGRNLAKKLGKRQTMAGRQFGEEKRREEGGAPELARAIAS